jgi:hypothetical protein
MKDETRLLFMKVFGTILVALMVVFLAGLFIFESGESGLDPALLVTLVPAAAIIIVLVATMSRLGRGVKSGLPIQDEMSQRIKERSGYLTLMASIYFVMGLMFYHGFLVEDYGFPGMVVRHAMLVTLIFILAVFGLIWLVLSRRGIR